MGGGGGGVGGGGGYTMIIPTWFHSTPKRMMEKNVKITEIFF